MTFALVLHVTLFAAQPTGRRSTSVRNDTIVSARAAVGYAVYLESWS